MANNMDNECEYYQHNIGFPQVILDTTKEQLKKLNRAGGIKTYHKKVVDQMLRFCEESYSRLLNDKKSGFIDVIKALELEKEFLYVIKDLRRRRDIIAELLHQEQLCRIPACTSITKYISQLYEELVLERQKYEVEKRKREALDVKYEVEKRKREDLDLKHEVEKRKREDLEIKHEVEKRKREALEAKVAKLQIQLEQTFHAMRLNEERGRFREEYRKACLEEDQIQTARKVTKVVEDAKQKLQEAEEAAVRILVHTPRTLDVFPTAPEVPCASPKSSCSSSTHQHFRNVDPCCDPSHYPEDTLNLSLPQILMRSTRKQIERFKASNNKTLYVAAFDHLLDLNETWYLAFLRAKEREDMDPEKAKKVEEEFILIIDELKMIKDWISKM